MRIFGVFPAIGSASLLMLLPGSCHHPPLQLHLLEYIWRASANPIHHTLCIMLEATFLL